MGRFDYLTATQLKLRATTSGRAYDIEQAMAANPTPPPVAFKPANYVDARPDWTATDIDRARAAGYGRPAGPPVYVGPLDPDPRLGGIGGPGPIVLPPPNNPGDPMMETLNPSGPAFNPLAPPGTPVFKQTADDPGGGGLAGATQSFCAGVTNPYWRALCLAGSNVIGGLIPGDPKTTGSPSPTLAGGNQCPAGYHRDTKTGGCVIDGLGGLLPGDVGRPDYVWTPQYGRYGAGVTPVLVQRNARACPSGFVLGKDGLCYDHLAKTNRAHNPGAKPMMTGGDMNALRRAHQLKKAITKLNRRFGTKPPKLCKPRGRR